MPVRFCSSIVDFSGKWMTLYHNICQCESSLQKTRGFGVAWIGCRSGDPHKCLTIRLQQQRHPTQCRRGCHTSCRVCMRISWLGNIRLVEVEQKQLEDEAEVAAVGQFSHPGLDSLSGEHLCRGLVTDVERRVPVMIRARCWRKEVRQERNFPPFQVFSVEQLAELEAFCHQLPLVLRGTGPRSADA